MYYIGRFLSALWKSWMALIFLFFLLVTYPVFFIIFLGKNNLKLAFKVKKFWAWFGLIFCGIWVKKKEIFPTAEMPNPCVIVANHASYLDIVISYVVFPKLYIFMAKAELLKVPLFRIFFRKMDIPVNRSSAKDAGRAFVRAAEEIDKGRSVFIFPEGTISNEGKLRAFKNGAFKLAIDKQVPIFPVTFIHNWKLLQNGGFFKSLGRPGVAWVIVHPPISTTGMTEENLVTLKEKVFYQMQETLTNAEKW